MNHHRIQSAVLGAICALLPAAHNAFAETNAAKATALMVVAHGSRDTNWNARVIQTVERMDWPGPKRVAFLTGKPPEHALPRVAAQLDQSGVRQIVVVPLLISSFSDHFEEIGYYVGQRKDMPGHDDASASPHEANMSSGHESGAPLKTKAVLHLTSAMDGDPLLSRILIDQVKPLVKDTRNESLVLVAHGPNDDAENERWLGHLRAHAKCLQEQYGFRRVAALTLRDDAPAKIRDAATEELRATVKNGAADSRVIVLPVLISVGRLQNEIRERLEGADYTMAEGGVANHPLAADWVRKQVEALVSRGHDCDRPSSQMTCCKRWPHSGC